MSTRRTPPAGTRTRAARSDPPDQPPGSYADPYGRDTRRDPYLPSEGWYARGWRGYRGLRRQARYSSMAWWGLKIVQGLLWGGGLVAFGALLAILVALGDGSAWPSRLGSALIVVGIIVLLRYALAPVTCRWIVTVPENRYYVVEDGDGYTLEYLGPGRMIVPWRWHSHVREYVDFSSIAVNEVVEDVLDSHALPVDIEVSVVMSFDPVNADPNVYAALRKLVAPEQFQGLIARDVRDIVRKHLNTLAPVQGQSGLLHDVQSLEAVIAEQLAGRAALGLTPAPTRPVAVHVRAPQKVKEAYQSLWARSARVREEAQTLLDIKEVARELGLSYEEAFQLFYILQRGTTPVRGAGRTLRGEEAGLPPLVVFRSPEPPVPEAPPEEEIAPGEVPPAPPELPRVIDDPLRAPDPFDLRRQRRDKRRSRRLDD